MWLEVLAGLQHSIRVMDFSPIKTPFAWFLPSTFVSTLHEFVTSRSALKSIDLNTLGTWPKHLLCVAQRKAVSSFIFCLRFLPYSLACSREGTASQSITASVFTEGWVQKLSKLTAICWLTAVDHGSTLSPSAFSLFPHHASQSNLLYVCDLKKHRWCVKVPLKNNKNSATIFLKQWLRRTINLDWKVVHYPKPANTSSKQNPYVPLRAAGVKDIKSQNALH